jgi:hypothetical protein
MEPETRGPDPSVPWGIQAAVAVRLRSRVLNGTAAAVGLEPGRASPAGRHRQLPVEVTHDISGPSRQGRGCPATTAYAAYGPPTLILPVPLPVGADRSVNLGDGGSIHEGNSGLKAILRSFDPIEPRRRIAQSTGETGPLAVAAHEVIDGHHRRPDEQHSMNRGRNKPVMLCIHAPTNGPSPRRFSTPTSADRANPILSSSRRRSEPRIASGSSVAVPSDQT